MKKIIFTTSILTVPVLTLALSGSFKTNVSYVLQMIYQIIPILFGLCFIMFFWGLSKFILNAGDAKARKDGKNYIMWGILALFVLISVRTIISFMASELDFNNGSGIPQLNSSGANSDAGTLNNVFKPEKITN